ncbi:hypothetical protein BX616_010745, partial [Lobosporangium transversale]
MQGLQSSALVPPQPAKPVQPENEQQLNEPQQRTQAIEALASSKANQFTQQTQQPQSQQQYQHHYPSDPRQLMLPLQHPQTPISSVDEHTFQNSDVSTEHSSRYFTRSLSTSWPLSNNHNLHQYQSQREYQRGVPPTSTSLTSASGHLALPAEDTNNSNRPRRWSLTGRFFGDRNRRKSLTEPFHIPHRCDNQSSHEKYHGHSTEQNSAKDRRASSPVNIQKNIVNASKHTNSSEQHHAPSATHGGERRTSITEIPRALLSSLRRVSISGFGADPPPSSSCSGNNEAMAAATAAVSASIAAALGTSPRNKNNQLDQLGHLDPETRPTHHEERHEEDHESSSEEERAWPGDNFYVVMAIPKESSQDPISLAKRLPTKSILKKRLADAANINAQNNNVVAPAAIARVEASNAPVADVNGAELIAPIATKSERMTKSPILGSEDVHPMATADMSAEEIKNLKMSTDHYAELITHSPTPSHPQPQEERSRSPQGEPFATIPSTSSPSSFSLSTDRSSQETIVDDADPRSCLNYNEAAMDHQKLMGPYSSSPKGAAIPPDSTPGIQSNSSHRSRPTGGWVQAAVIPEGGELSQAEMLDNEMVSINQGLNYSNNFDNNYSYKLQRNGTIDSNSSNNRGENSSQQFGYDQIQDQGQGHPGQDKRRSINFMDRIEIIPVYRKNEYDRQSDKHATFLVLTPELKNEIREELNTYKLREMPVHVD